MKQVYTITVYTEDQIGIVGRIATIISRRKINIDSLNTCPSEIEGIHRFTIVIHEAEEVVRKLCRQIEKNVEVLKAYYHTDADIIWQEMALYKVPTSIVEEKLVVERFLRQYGARVVAIRKDYTIFEATGQREELNALVEKFAKFGLIEFVRSARIAIIKASDGFHRKLKEFEKSEPGEEVIENEFLNDNERVFTL